MHSGRLGSSLSLFQSTTGTLLLSRVFSTPKARGNNSSLTLPDSVADKLKDMQLDLASQFVCDVSPISGSYTPSSTLPTTSSEFNSNLERMAKYYFQQGGKLFRPTISLLVANACNLSVKHSSRIELRQEASEISLNQYRIGMISEMIHTASLVHDDVIDEADTRRGNASVNAVWGNKMAVLVGDFILARATQVLCSIGKPDVISVMASIIEDLVMGEFMQMTSKSDSDEDVLEKYMLKTYKKTASLFANSCRSVAMLAGGDEDMQFRAHEYGRHLGLSFQLVDDLLDFVASPTELGKPAASDLKQGLSTGPVIYAAREFPELATLMKRKFCEEGDAERARDIVLKSSGLEQTRELARHHSLEAARLASTFSNVEGASDVLVQFALSQMERNV